MNANFKILISIKIMHIKKIAMLQVLVRKYKHNQVKMATFSWLELNKLCNWVYTWIWIYETYIWSVPGWKKDPRSYLRN